MPGTLFAGSKPSVRYRCRRSEMPDTGTLPDISSSPFPMPLPSGFASRYRALQQGRSAAIAAGLVGAFATLVVWALHSRFPQDGFLFLYIPVISAVAYFGGRGSGLATTVVSLIGSWYFILPPEYPF